MRCMQNGDNCLPVQLTLLLSVNEETWSLLERQRRPAILAPDQGSYREFRPPAIRAVVEVAAEPELAVRLQYFGVTRTNERTISLQQRRSTAVHQVLAVTVQVRASNLTAAANPNVVSAVRSPAATVPVDEEIEVITALVNVRRFDYRVVGQRQQRCAGALYLAGGGIKFNQFETAPELASDIQCLTLEVRATAGSMALKMSSVFERTTIPSSFHAKFGSSGSKVAFEASVSMAAVGRRSFICAKF